MKYIETFREGEKISEIYLCKHKTSAVTKNGKPYDSAVLQDKTGTVDAKIWDPNSLGIDDFDALDYVEVVADVVVFNGATQLNVKRVRKASEGEYDPKNYLPVSEKNIDGMFEEFLKLIGSIKNTYLKTLLERFFVEDKDFAKKFGMLIAFSFLCNDPDIDFVESVRCNKQKEITGFDGIDVNQVEYLKKYL